MIESKNGVSLQLCYDCQDKTADFLQCNLYEIQLQAVPPTVS